MAVITSGKTFANGEQLTADKLNQVITAATFATGAIDNGVMQIVGDAITIAEGGVSTAKIADSNVTKAKIENVANMKVLGNTSGSANSPQEVDILDENDMSSNSDTSLATQQSIKTYVDAGDADPSRVYNSTSHSTVSGNSQQNTTGRPLWVSFTCLSNAAALNFILGEISPNSDMSSLTRIGQTRIVSRSGYSSGGQVTMIVPAGYYWRFSFSPSTITGKVHSSFIL